MGAEFLVEGDYDELRYLRGSICLYKGKAVYVRQSDKNHRLQISQVSDPFVIETVDYRTKDFRYNSPPLGYMNIEREAFYIKRRAGSGRTAAIYQDSLIVTPDSRRLGCLSNCPEGLWVLRKEFAQCVQGEHPSFYEAAEKIKSGEVRGMAFHRHLAIVKGERGRIDLEKRGTETIATLKGKKLVLFDESFYSTLLRNLPKDFKENGYDVTAL